MANQRPDWDINIYDGSVLGNGDTENRAVIAIYDRNVSTSDPVHSSTFIPSTEIEEDMWLTPDELDAVGGPLYGDKVDVIRDAFKRAETEHDSWVHARASRALGGQGRVAAGVPAGGQFASVSRPESSVTLSTEPAADRAPKPQGATTYPRTDRAKPLADAARTVELAAAVDDIADAIRASHPKATAVRLRYVEPTAGWDFEALLDGDEQITPEPWQASDDEALWSTEEHISPLLRFVVSGNDDLATSGLATPINEDTRKPGSREYRIELDPTAGRRPRAEIVNDALADIRAVLDSTGSEQ